MEPSNKTTIVKGIDLDEVYPLINTRALFTGQWKFRRAGGLEEAGAWPAFEEWKARARDENIFEPKAVYRLGLRIANCGFRICQSAISNSQSAIRNPQFALQLVTLGPRVAKECARLFAENKYTDYLYLHGLAVVSTEALAEYVHRRILKELSFDAAKPLPRGSRISPGYSVWPELKDQEIICRLLGAERIGVTLTETYQLVPEYSTSAMIIVDSDAKMPYTLA